MILRLLLWASASAGHVVLLAAILNRLQGYAIPPRLLHPLEKAFLAAMGLGPCAALIVAIVVGASSEGPLARVYLAWAIAMTAILVVWMLRRSARQVPRIVRRGPEVTRRPLAAMTPREALHRPGLAWRLATALPGNEFLDLYDVRTSVQPRAIEGRDVGPRTPLRLVHLSDLHLAGIMSRAFYRRAIEAAIAEPPDAILVTGDLVETEECLEWVDEVFGPLAAAAPTWFVLGNHDEYLPRPRRLVERLEAAGLVSLTGERRTATIRDWRIELLGDGYPWFAPFPDVDASRQGVDLVIGLAHSPDRWQAARARGVHLTLAGHTHGGQIRIPFLGPLFCPSRFGSRYSRGWFERDGRRMFVHQGVAGVLPVRYLCPPEIVRIDVLPPEREAALVGAPPGEQDVESIRPR